MKKDNNLIIQPPIGYIDWLSELKIKIHNAQQRATLAVNNELVRLYWQIGNEILTRQEKQGWGAKVIERLAQDLRTAFPEMRGFSRTNLLYMRSFAEGWPDEQIVQQLVGKLPWGHNLVLLCKTKNKIVAEYALSDKTQPMGIAEFKLLESLPANLQNQLPSIEDIERELAGVENDE
jgi:predicted nuclease of restriction endonuclease-like (RecB) superfamily